MLCPPPPAIVENFWALSQCFGKQKSAILIDWTVSHDHFAMSLNLGIFQTVESVIQSINQP